MRTKEANRFKDKLESLSLNSSKANLVESSVPVNRDRFKGKNKKDQKLLKHQNHLKKQMAEFRSRRLSAMFVENQATKLSLQPS